MTSWVYKRGYITWKMDKKTVKNNDATKITENQKDIFIEAIENDYTIAEACAQAHFAPTTYYNYIKWDEDFKMRVDWARTKLLRDAKDKVHAWVLKDKDWEFSLKVLKARCPEQYNTQKIESKNEVKAEVEYKDIDSMLVEYYED